MAKENTQTQAAPRKYKVGLSRSFRIPQYQGKPKTGVVYKRGGFDFYGEDGKDFVIVEESQLEKFKLAQNQQFAHSPLIYEFDKNLYIEEVK